MLSVRGLTKAYGGRVVVEDLDLDVAAAVSPRLAELLAPEWRQHQIGRAHV